ncbi:DUF6625 family protein [Bacteroides hominis]|uniref:DUF6625 family protein n=1 Tax=Bacteroides hominis TaxID=2763023 RepID=UPI003D6BF7B2
MKYQVAQIIPYFGKWPKWIELYFYSCGQNPEIDFIFYTDCPLPQQIYSNTKFISISFKAYCKLVGERLNIDYSIESTYKLTDLKPFIGTIHQEELKIYDFWGFGDLDLVYGDLSMIVNDKTLDRYELLTTHNYHVAGHFTLCKNNEYWRTLCFKIKDWQKRLIDSQHYAFDENEWSGLVNPFIKYIHCIHRLLFKPFRIHYFTVLDLLNPLLVNKCLFKEYWTSPYAGPENGIEKEWIYDITSHKIIDPKEREIPYLHFLFFKKTPWLDTEYYWKEGYWQIDNNYSLSDKEHFKGYKKIIFNYKEVKGYLS